MKKLISILAAATALVAGGAAANASTPASEPALTLSPSTVPAATEFRAVLNGCAAGETVTFVIEEIDLDPVTAPCADPGASASASLVAPTLGGPWTVTATGSTSGASASASLTVTGGEEVPDDDMPSTGSSSGPIALVGVGFVALGALLALIANARRRTPHIG